MKAPKRVPPSFNPIVAPSESKIKSPTTSSVKSAGASILGVVNVPIVVPSPILP